MNGSYGSMSHGAHAATLEQSSAQHGQQCAYECGRNGGWANSEQDCRSSGDSMISGMDGIDDVLDLDLLSDEELMEGLFGRVERETGPFTIQSCPVEDKFARLRLKQ